MPKPRLLALLVLTTALGASLYTNVTLSSRLDSAQATVRHLEGQALAARAGLPDAAPETAAANVPAPAPPTPTEARCPDPIPCPGPAEVEVVVTPDGRRLRNETDRETYARDLLTTQIDEAFADEPMAPAQRQRVVELLLHVRELRGENRGGNMRDALIDAETEFLEETGMAVGEFLDTIAPRAPARPIDVSSGTVAEQPGDERKRFPDELSRRLGVTEPGSREVLAEDGTWQPTEE